MSIEASTLDGDYQRPSASREVRKQLASEGDASFPSARPKETWEDWMIWDESSHGTSKHSLRMSESPLSTEATVGSRKRKSTADDSPAAHTVATEPSKKPTTSNRSHNVVERRYRTNINTKIADLRDSIPALKTVTSSTVQSPSNNDASAQKLNKATILSTAVSYIHDLERDKKRLETEVSELRTRLRSSKREDDYVCPTAGTDQALSTTPISVPQQATPESSTSSSWENPAQGMIQVPEDMRRLRTTAMQAQYTERPYLGNDQDEPEGSNFVDIGQSGGRRARQIGKLMVGSFAGLMVVQGFGSKQPDEGTHSRRSLPGFPSLSSWTTIAQASLKYPRHISSYNTPYLFMAIEGFFVVFLLGFGVFLYAFCSKPKRRKPDVSHRPVSTPSLASPLEVRRNAWLTSIQTLRVPRHEMFPEWIAVNLEALHYVVRQAVGWRGYSWITGQIEDDEIARVRAWDIAIDAQLMGGDAEISGSRLILSILASGTLPTTSARLMLKALHLRILLWKACRHGKGSLWSIMHKVAAILAAQQWRRAQRLQRAPSPKDVQLFDEVEKLPEHLTALLQLSCNEVLIDPLIQRAYNLAWSRPTQEDVKQSDPEMDLVVEDSTIRSPLDAMCAWLSSSTLHKALLASLADNEGKSTSELEWNFGVALHTAPRASIAQARALAANAVFVDANRQSALSMLSEDFPSTALTRNAQSTAGSSHSALFIDSSMPEAIGYDVTLATYCALALSKLEAVSVPPSAVEEALELVSLGYQNVDNLTWLSYAAAHRLIYVLTQDHQNVNNQYRRLLAPMIPRLTNWVEDNNKARGGVGDQYDCSQEVHTSEATANLGRPLNELNESVDPSPTTDTVVEEPTNEAVTIHETMLVREDVDKKRQSRCSLDSGYGSSLP